ncbi:flagellin [Rhodobacter sp. SGA-6-6]|uniref:flagellin n=1 Tax=Rhodobacter sp. SGA-6-6 TaxID=2710882 RepID=UPI0013EC29CA|nr:flagellin [Rhodobacter sp. SGA-6-6]NGM44385.1 flagellin [Rhodobacter sp. SGA-6-6]
MSSILTNISAMVALQTMKGINTSMGKVQNEISTGKTVATAKDNAAVWAISKVMESDVKGFKGIADSLSLGSSTLSVASKASETIADLLTDMKGKIVAAQEENQDRSKLQTDIVALKEQIASIVGGAQFNGLNLISGTEDVNILASLDRSASGVVASEITVNRQDLGTAAGTYGTGTSLAANGTILNGASAVAAAGETAQVTFAGTWAANDTAQLTVGGVVLNHTAAGASVADIATHFAGAINALGLEGVTAANAAGVLTITSTRAFEGLAVTQSSTTAGDGTSDITAVNGAAPTGSNSATASTVRQRAEQLSFSTSAKVAEGDGYRVTIGTSSYSYVAGKNETMEDVAKGLKIAIDSAGAEGVTTRVTQDTTTGAWMLNVDNDGSGSASLAFSATGNAGGKASGGLFGLDSIDVTTDKGAQAALSNIETMIDRAIDAAAEFGSAQGRIDTQNDFVSALTDALTAGIGTLVDADMEEASARLQALQVQQQLGIQALSIANQQPQNLLSLFR